MDSTGTTSPALGLTNVGASNGLLRQYFPRGWTSPPSFATTSTMPPRDSTADSASTCWKHPPKFSSRYWQNQEHKFVLHLLLESADGGLAV